MKNSVKTFTLLFALVALSFTVTAQTATTTTSTGVIYSVGFETGISAGNFNTSYRWNVGGSIQADIPVAGQLYATVNAGYLNFNGKDNINGSGLSAPNIRLLPVMAGFKFFPVKMFYVQGDAGAAIALNKTETGFTQTAAFLYSPQIGTVFNVGGKNYIDAGLRYEGTTKFVSSVENSKINFFGLRIAYAFQIK
jgi:hypothetical protein